MPTLEIALLGDFRLAVGSEPITTIKQPRLQSLLAYLLLHRQSPQSRQQLAFTFWPDVTEMQARNNLRQALYQIRRALPPDGDYLSADVNTVQWAPQAPLRLDVAAFEAEAARAAALERASEPQAAAAALRHAADLYAGDLLPSCYDEWIIPERDRLRQRCLTLLTRLVGLLEELRDYTAALDYAQRLLNLEVLNEDAYLGLMRLHALRNDRVSALRVYHACVTALRREVGVEPGAPLREAYERLLSAGSSPASPAPVALVAAAPLVGRQPEWQRLRAAWQQAEAGRPGLVLITGDAGIGKTRLAEEMLNWASQQGYRCARTRAYAAEGRLSYSPVAEWLRSPPLAAALGRLEPIWLSEIARLLPELLAANPRLPLPGPLTEFWQRQRFFEALARGLLASTAPLVLQLDDLQWCDRETLEWLHYLLRFAPGAPLLIVGTARTEELTGNAALQEVLSSLRRTGQLVTFALGPLAASETAQLAASLLGRALEGPAARRLFEESEGNPLFALEMARAQYGEADAEAAWPELPEADAPGVLPPLVYAVIADRLSHLSPPAAALAGVAATVGRAFAVEVLAHCTGQPEATLVAALDELWQRRIIRELGGQAYDFSHDKLREVAYRELSPMQRRRLHERVAQALSELYAANLDPLAAQIAAHFEQAGQAKPAIEHYQRAATVAQRLFAHDEAIGLLKKALALLQTLPPDSRRDERELALQVALGVSLVVTQGYASPEVVTAYSRASQLGQRLARPPIPPILRALALAHIIRRELQPALALGLQLRELADQQQDPVLVVEAHYVLGVTHFWRADFVAAREHLQAALAHYAPGQAPTHIALYSQDPKVVCLCRLAFNLWCLGDFAQAHQLNQAALAYARQLNHPFSLAYAFGWDLAMLCCLRAVQDARACAEALMALGQAHRLGIFVAEAQVFHGWALAQQGMYQAGLAEMRHGLTLATPLHRTLFIGLMSELLGQAGEVEQGLGELERGLAEVEQTGQRWCEADLFRLQGELLQRQGNDLEAEQALERALALARAQQAGAFELRAANSLARLWLGQGRREQARGLLAPIVSRLSEQPAVRDLAAARALWERLAG